MMVGIHEGNPRMPHRELHGCWLYIKSFIILMRLLDISLYCISLFSLFATEETLSSCRNLTLLHFKWLEEVL